VPGRCGQRGPRVRRAVAAERCELVVDRVLARDRGLAAASVSEKTSRWTNASGFRPALRTVRRLLLLCPRRSAALSDTAIRLSAVSVIVLLRYDTLRDAIYTSANHCRTPSIRCARPHGLELSAGRPPRTAGLRVLQTGFTQTVYWILAASKGWIKLTWLFSRY